MTMEDSGSDTSHTQLTDYDYGVEDDDDYYYHDDDDDDDFESWDRYDELGHNFEGKFERACTSGGGSGSNNSGTGQSIYSSKHVRIKLARTDTVTAERTNHQQQKKASRKQQNKLTSSSSTKNSKKKKKAGNK